MEFSVLSNNLKMPMMGFGVFQVTDKNVCKQSVLNAIRTGYRLIDTAAVYGDGELKKQLAGAQFYRVWLANNRVELDELKSGRQDRKSVV